MDDYVCFITPIDYCVIKFHRQDFLWKLLSFHTEMISAKFPCEDVLLRGGYEEMQKMQICKILRALSIRNQGVWI